MRTNQLFTKTFIFFCLITVGYGQNTTNLGDQSGNQGNNNTFLGYRAGRFVTSDNSSMVGSNAGLSNTIGSGNNFFGFNAGRNNTEGNNNVFMGSSAGQTNVVGVSNIYIGTSAGRLGTGSRNVFVGTNAGRENPDGNGNIFLGHRAGFNTSQSNRLYIENSDADIPLVYGNFNLDQLGVNTTTIPTGMTMAVGGSLIAEDGIFATNRLAIGTTDDDPGYSLTVKGKIHVQEVRVDLLGAVAPDYVFVPGYDLKTLKEIEDHIAENGHLPNIPSAEDMAENGINLKEMNLKLLEKIEELTLHAIDLNKAVQQQKEKNKLLEKRLEKLESLLSKD